MGSESDSASHDERDDDDDEEYEEAGGGNRFLGFMFGNVDNSGDLDVDYLDEDAKEHLAALADKLGHSLTEINLSVKSLRTPADAAEQDYDEKAEDAVDYEDIDEQYEGPETQAVTEEDYLLPKKDYFFAEASRSTPAATSSVFDDENYDEDEEPETEPRAEDTKVEVQTLTISGDQDEYLEVFAEQVIHTEDDQQLDSLDTDDMECAFEESIEDACEAVEEPVDGKGSIPLPILCIEDGMEILRFSEIFGVNEPLKKGIRRDHRQSLPKERHKFLDASSIVEEDEEGFLKGSGQGFHIMKQEHRVLHDILVSDDGDDSEVPGFGIVHGVAAMSLQDEQVKDSCRSEEPMKEDPTADLSVGWKSPLWPDFYPLDQQDWEDKILWDSSPAASDNSAESCEISGPDLEGLVIRERDMVTRTINFPSELDSSMRELDIETVVSDHQSELPMEPSKENHSSFLHNFPVLLESLNSNNFMATIPPLSGSKYHPQFLRLESRLELDDHNHTDGRNDKVAAELRRSDARRRFSKLTQNRDMLEGSWLDNIIWEPHKPISKPKLILDLQDEQMLFEIPNNKESKHLRLHAGAMIITRSLKSSSVDCLELPGHGGQIGWRNIGNDDFYSKRKTSHQLKSDSKKRAVHGIRVYHSIPALRLQTMKLKLSNKDVANFHRPKALWYPHDNEVAVKEQGKLPTQGPMKVLLKSLGGKGSKLHVDADETVSSVKEKASKKLDFKLSETVKIFYLGEELEDNKSLTIQCVQPNSLLHLVRTKLHLLPRAQKLPGENKSLRPPGAFKKKSDLSLKDGHVFLMEYCEERPLLLSNPGMGARLCTYYQKSTPGDQTGALVLNGNNIVGSVLTLDPADKSPFLGDIKAGFSQSSLETNMYRAPVFPHKVPTTDYLLVRSAKGKLSIRRIDRIHVVGQQEPLKEVMSPGTKGLQAYLTERLYVYVCRYFREQEKRGLIPSIRVDELSSQFPYLSEANIRKRLKDYAYLQRDRNGKLLWVMKRNSRIPPEEELRRKVSPEDVCAYESMQAGLYRLKHLGITRLTQPNGISSAMSQLPDEAIALAAASHIERELQITPWNLSSNFVACTNQDRENIERLEITGVGDPSGRGLGFSYVRTAPKAPMASAMAKKKTAAARGGSTVTGTDADLRRLSMEAAREVLLKFNVPEEHIAKQTRWHRIALIRKLSSEQAASGVKVDPTTISKYARGQRMSFLQLQQQTREKCQEIWDRQVQCLSAVDGDENESESEANSLDSFAGDLENLLDAEECEEGEEGNFDSKPDKIDGVKGLKMRRHASLAQAEEEIEDEAAEAAELFKMLMDDNEGERKKKKKARVMWEEPGLAPCSQSSFGFENTEPVKKNAGAKKIIGTAQPSSSYTSKENIARDSKEVESYLKRNVSSKTKPMKKNDTSHIGLPSKKVKIVTDGIKTFKEKKSARERFACGACGQVGHMKTNKNCPRYRENVEPQDEATDLDKAPGKSTTVEPSSQVQQKMKKLVSKGATKGSLVEGSDGENITKKAKVVPLKFKCGSADIPPDKASQLISDQPVTSDAETGNNKSAVKVNKITFSNKMKTEDAQVESRKPSIFIRPPVDTDKVQVESHKPSLVIRPPTNADREHVEARKANIVIRPPTEVEREQPHKKIIIRRPKEIVDVDQVSQDGSPDLEYRKTKRIVELSSFDSRGKQENMRLIEESTLKRKQREENRRWEEEIRRRNEEKLRMERERRIYEQRMLEEQERLDELRRYEEDIRLEREEEEEERRKANKNKKKKKKAEIRDEYLEDYQARKVDRRMPERDRGTKRRPAVEAGRYSAEYASSVKRRRGGEVGLANILEGIVEHLKARQEVSYLFIKPVSKKEAPDYYDIIKNPMDLSTMKEKARKMEYKNREQFRQDMYQITMNAHIYNDKRNPFIPPLADQLLELCDHMLIEHEDGLDEAESGIENRD